MRDGENRESPGGSQSPPKGRRRLLLGSLVAVPVCLAVAFAYFVFSCGREAQEAMAEADRLDQAWGIQELEQERAAIPASANEELRLLIRNGHRASRESIDTLHATYSIEVTDLRRNSEVTTHRVEWWQADGRYRDLPRISASTVSFLASPLGQGPFLAASALIPARTRYRCSEEWIRPARLGSSQGGSREFPAIHQKKETVIKDRLQPSLT